ncbi:MAG TPA: zf-HC2 domain-containing protein [Vicinamibacterales bacterium]
MTCREFADFMMDYIAGQLPVDSRALFERHLARCPKCPKYFEQYKATVAAGKTAFECPDDEVPADVPEDLIQAILAVKPR